jgi:prepilin-type N-terminal cleavage/methylation domain-containing protein
VIPALEPHDAAADDEEVMRRLKAEDGFGLIELMIAVTILSIALLALAAGYDQAFLALHRSSKETVATVLADRQLELYRALPYASVGLDATTVDAVTTPTDPGYDAVYATDPVLATETDVTAASCTGSPLPARCLPVQTQTGSDGRSYRVETYVVDTTDPNNTGNRWTERVLTVVVQDASSSTSPELTRMTTAFDRGPNG